MAATAKEKLVIPERVITGSWVASMISPHVYRRSVEVSLHHDGSGVQSQCQVHRFNHDEHVCAFFKRAALVSPSCSTPDPIVESILL